MLNVANSKAALLWWGTGTRSDSGGRLDRVYVWEVDLEDPEDPEVGVNAHGSARGLRDETDTSVVAGSGRFVRVVQAKSLAEYREWERVRQPRLRA